MAVLREKNGGNWEIAVQLHGKVLPPKSSWLSLIISMEKRGAGRCMCWIIICSWVSVAIIHFQILSPRSSLNNLNGVMP